MIDPTSLFYSFVVASAATLSGLVLGLLYFRGLRTAVDLLAKGRGLLLPVALTLVRFGGVISVLSLLVQLGAVPMIACFVGFLLARTIALRSFAEAR